jgi:FdhE protein
LSEQPAVIAAARLPDPARLFAARAARLAALADGHAAAPFLSLLARVARGQEVAAREVRLPAALPLAQAARQFDPARAPRPAAWVQMLRVVLGTARSPDLPPPALAAIARLDAASGAELDALAEGVLSGDGADLAAAPFVGAALQAAYAVLAAGLDPAGLGEGWGICPACGFPPVAASVLGDDRLRYVSCGLCATAWHVPRVHCVACRGNTGIAYFEVEGGAPGVKAEACPTCRAYLKVVDLAQVPSAEPLADDAATLVLDLLLGEQGWRRVGRNLLAPAGEPA